MVCRYITLGKALVQVCVLDRDWRGIFPNVVRDVNGNLLGAARASAQDTCKHGTQYKDGCDEYLEA